MRDTTSKEARQLEQLKRRFDKAYKEMSKATTGEVDSNLTTEADSNIKYSIAYTTDNIPAVIIENDILDGVDESEWPKVAKEEMKKFSEGIPVHGKLIKINLDDRKEFTKGKDSRFYKRTNKEIYKDKLNSGGNANEIVIASTDYVNEELHHERKDDFVEFARGNVLIQSFNNQYKAEVIVGKKEDGSLHLYDVIDYTPATFTLKKKKDVNPPITELSAFSSHATSSKEILTKDSTKSNKKYSLSDNQVRKLTKEQQEYFKDSKVRDENNIPTDGYAVYGKDV